VKTVDCQYCPYDFPLTAERCPHCARPGLFPNVRMAEEPEEYQALASRHEEAKREANERGAASRLHDFEFAFASSHAVMNRSANELQRLTSSQEELYATYYGLRDAGVRLPAGSKWDSLRVPTDDALFPGYKEQIRFGALSLNERGLSTYGECTLVIRDDMIAHRASVFEENSVLWMEHHNIKMAEAHNLPRGFRATWEERAKLAVAKIGGRIESDTASGSFPNLLLRQGATSTEDEFIEVHIWGPLTVRSLKLVGLPRKRRRSSAAVMAACRERLDKFGVPVGTI